MTTQDYSKRSAEEAKTHELLACYLEQDSGQHPWEVYALAQAIKALWTSSVTLSHLVLVAAALSGQPVNTEAAQKQLTKMVRAKVMRSRVNHGTRLYEVNY
jgi:hypothetical protein